jgi:hypothetical protein
VTDQDDISPWARDDWSSSDTPALDALTAPVDPTGSGPRPQRHTATDVPADARPAPQGPHRSQLWIAAAFGAVLLIGGVVALVRNDRTDREVTATAEAGAVSSPDPTEALDAPTTTTATAGVPTFWNDDTVATTDRAGDDRLEMASSEVGESPVWSRWSIDVPPPLDVISVPTEVAAFGTDRILYRIGVPSGQVQAMRMSSWGATAQAVVGEDAIVVFTSTDVTIVRDDEPIIRVPVTNGVIFVEAWPGTPRFIVTTPSLALSGREQQLILEPDGALVPVEAEVVGGGIFDGRAFLPDGRVAVNRPGGVYAVSLDQPTTRLSDGDLLAVGSAHYAVEECDESLQCTGFVVDSATGERTEVTLGALSEGFTDPSTRISPDGRKVVFTDRTRATGIRQLLDVATGSVIDVGRVDELVHPDSWAADSSGIFAAEGGSVVFHPADNGVRVVLDGIDRIASVATRRVASGE